MASNGPNLGLIEYETQGTVWYTALKALLRGLDGMVHCVVVDKDLTSPPTPSNGAVYIVAAGGSGAWSGHDGKLARYQTVDGTTWEFFTAKEGWLAYVQDENKLYYHTGSAWAIVPASLLDVSTLQPLDTDLTAIAALISAADKVPYATGSGTWALADFKASLRSLGAAASMPALTTLLFSGAEVSQAADTSVANNTLVIPDFTATDTYDTDAYHDTGTNPSRLTIPSGFDGKFDLWFAYYVQNASDPATGQLTLQILKNGAAIYNEKRSWVAENPAATDAEDWSGTIHIPGVAAVATDYFQVQVLQTSGATRNLLGTTSSSGTSSIFKIRRVG